jgi:hypothetical protein
MRDKNGRYMKKQTNIIIDIPSLSSLFKYAIIIFVFAPWIHLLIFKFNLLLFIEEFLSYLFGPKIIEQSSECKCKSGEPPY